MVVEEKQGVNFFVYFQWRPDKHGGKTRFVRDKVLKQNGNQV